MRATTGYSITRQILDIDEAMGKDFMLILQNEYCDTITHRALGFIVNPLQLPLGLLYTRATLYCRGY